jgi:hypothetical protein
MFTFHVLAHDPTDDTVEFEACDARGVRVLHVIARVAVTPGNVLVLPDFIVYRKRPMSLRQQLRQVVREFTRETGSAELHVRGTRRTTGAGPGRIPKPVRFR